MKAFLMAAGLGTRLRPITSNKPKCLVPINKKPLLWYWDQLFDKYKINEVLINTHHFSDQVIDYLKDFPRFTYTYEPELLGSAGTLYHNKDFIDSNEPFFICYADNLTNTNLSKMLAFHMQKQALLTMRLFRTSDPSACGIVQLDNNNKIINFEEKPSCPISNLANGGIYITDNRIFDYINKDNRDLGREILPIIPNSFGYESKEYLLDIGTIKNYLKAQEDVTYGLYY